jgi:hypothetical protein
MGEASVGLSPIEAEREKFLSSLRSFAAKCFTQFVRFAVSPTAWLQHRAGRPDGERNNPVEFAALPGYFSLMRRLIFFLMLCSLFAAVFSAEAATGRVIKVLPQLLDLQGRQTLSPSLYERDAYQAFLRVHTNDVSGMRFAVQWQAGGKSAVPLKLRIEARGTAKGDLPSHTVLEREVKPGGWFSHWISLPITGEDYKKFGSVTAWHATLWEGDRLLSEQTSFLW